MELHLVPGLEGEGSGDQADRLDEAERLLRRTRQRLEELADRLAEIRGNMGPDPRGSGMGERDDKTDPIGPDLSSLGPEFPRFPE